MPPPQLNLGARLELINSATETYYAQNPICLDDLRQKTVVIIGQRLASAQVSQCILRLRGWKIYSRVPPLPGSIPFPYGQREPQQTTGVFKLVDNIEGFVPLADVVVMVSPQFCSASCIC